MHKLIPLLLLLASSARAETTSCTQITTLPATLSTSGIYCLKGNLSISLSTSSPAITISGKGIVLDLNGWTLSNSYGTFGYGIGIRITGSNATVKNGIVTNFQTGISLSGSALKVEELELVKNFNGVMISGATSYLVQHNHISNPGGGNWGIYLSSVGEGSIVENVTCGMTVAIYVVAGGLYTLIDNNRLGAAGYGLYFDTNGQAVIRNNVTASNSGNHLNGYVIDKGGND